MSEEEKKKEEEKEDNENKDNENKRPDLSRLAMATSGWECSADGGTC